MRLVIESQGFACRFHGSLRKPLGGVGSRRKVARQERRLVSKHEGGLGVIARSTSSGERQEEEDAADAPVLAPVLVSGL